MSQFMNHFEVVNGEAIIPNDVTTIAPGVFAGRSDIEMVLMPNNIELLCGYNFVNCENLREVRLSKNMDVLYGNTFVNCPRLQVVGILDGITSIEDDAIVNCDSLRALTIPRSVSDFGHSIVRNCKNLKRVIFNRDYFSSGCIFDSCLNIEEIVVHGKTHKLNRMSHVDFVDGQIVVPDGVTVIDTGVFSNNNDINAVAIPDTVFCVSGYNFMHCDNLLEVKLPASMSVLESCTFFDCQKLQSIVMNNGLRRIDGYAISGCGQLRELQIPRSVEFMADKSVSFCDNLEKVIMSADVFMVTKNWPFCDCPNIKEVICDGKPLTRDLFRAYMCSPYHVHINPDSVVRYPYGEMTEARLEKIMSKLPACVK